MKVLKILVAFLPALLISAISFAQIDLVSAKDCMARVKENSKVIFIDASKAKNYDVNHIKGAININHNDLYQPGQIEGLIKSPEEIAAYFGSKGISENSEIVIYDEGSQKYATNIYWILKYVGANNVRILHKDMEQCREARVPLTAAPSSLPAVTFTPIVHPEIFASIDEVKAGLNQPNVVLVDCRTPEEYRGEKDSNGHLPGAININYESLVTTSGAFKPEEELKVIAEKAGITADKEIILYCKTGVRAAVGFVAFKIVLGYKNVRLYEGAYVEWVAKNNEIVQ